MEGTLWRGGGPPCQRRCSWESATGDPAGTGGRLPGRPPRCAPDPDRRSWSEKQSTLSYLMETRRSIFDVWYESSRLRARKDPARVPLSQVKVQGQGRPRHVCAFALLQPDVKCITDGSRILNSHLEQLHLFPPGE